MAELTDEQIAEEEAFLKGLPRINWGAFFMPGIWGPAHGFWVAILFYPLWVFIDYLIYGAYINPQPWTIGIAVLSAVVLFVITYFFAKVSQPFAAHRAANRGITREQYLKRERIWAVVSFLIAIAALAWATYYNLEVRTVLK
ncbi:MAG: viscotoxin-A3 [Eggerthellaceae bacterium]|nr:viscotoxin-A3 [Eggerthellaceae bacterium]